MNPLQTHAQGGGKVGKLRWSKRVKTSVKVRGLLDVYEVVHSRRGEAERDARFGALHLGIRVTDQTRYLVLN